jgi:glycerophosphoryl diester phosphodiesterase
MRKPFIFLCLLAAAGLLAWAVVTRFGAAPATAEYRDVVATRPSVTTRRPNLQMLRIGHRGAARFAPENTLAGIQKALELGFEYIEMDVRSTRDGVPVLLHDTTVDRTTSGSGRIGELTYAEVARLDAGSWFDPAFAGERIPRLEDALQLIQGRACIFWDTKGPPTARMVELFQQYGFGDDCLIITFGGLGRGDSLRKTQPLLDLWPAAPLLPVARNHADVRAALAEFPHIRGVRVMRSLATPELVDTAHSLGLLVVSITLQQSDNREYYQRLMDAGVDATMLENIDEYDALLDELEAQHAGEIETISTN